MVLEKTVNADTGMDGFVLYGDAKMLPLTMIPMFLLH
jgi:hypothetical protein